MEILILLGLGFVFFNFFKPGKNKKQGSNKRPPKAEITAKTSSAKETSFHIINRIDTDISEKFTCRIDNTGSPWVRVQKKEPGGETWEYNVLTFKWKNKDDRLENQNIITKLIREEWNRLKEKHGWEIEGPKKYKKNPLITDADIKTEEIALAYDTASLERLDSHIEIKGSKPNPHIVDLKTLSCTCEDFKKLRQGFPAGDIRRVCKHQARAIIQSKMNTKITTDKRIMAIVRGSKDRGFTVYFLALKATIQEQSKPPMPFYVFVEPDNPWLNVVAFGTNSYFRYGFNALEKRWAHRDNPFPEGSKRNGNKAMDIIVDRYGLSIG